MPVQALNRPTREAIYRHVLEDVRQNIKLRGGDPDDPLMLAGRCLEFAFCAARVLVMTPGQPRTLLQAGSASWPRRPRHESHMDDYQFSYVWEPDHPLTQMALMGVMGTHERGIVLPEMHVWLGVPSTGEIIDFTTGLWPLCCKDTLGKDWPGPLPPEFFWDFRVPEGVVYKPDRAATLFAAKVILSNIEEVT